MGLLAGELTTGILRSSKKNKINKFESLNSSVNVKHGNTSEKPDRPWAYIREDLMSEDRGLSVFMRFGGGGRLVLGRPYFRRGMLSEFCVIPVL